MKRLIALTVAVLMTGAARPAPVSDDIDGEAVLEEVWQLVQRDFLDPEFNGADWPAMLEAYRESARRARNAGNHKAM